MYRFMRFPLFKTKALTVSYDNGVIYDKKLIKILDENGIKGTFNLNSGEWGFRRRLPQDEAYELLADGRHEVAVHGEHHLSLDEIPSSSALAEILNDRKNLEKIFGRIIRGMSYANNSYGENVKNLIKQCGIVYARTTTETECFDIPQDFLAMPTTCHHDNPRLNELVDKFLAPDINYYWAVTPRLFSLWGHSYEFNDNNNWDVIENFAKRVGNRDDVWYATCIELYEYVRAYDSLIYSADGNTIRNPTDTDVYLCYYGKNFVVPAAKQITVEVNKTVR